MAVTREQVLAWITTSANQDFVSPIYEKANGELQFGVFNEAEMIAFATIARADLEATIAEQAKEIAGQNRRLNKDGRCDRSR